MPVDFSCMLGGIQPVYADSPVLEIVACDYPPYEFATPENGLRGFDVDVVEEALRRAGYDTSFVFYPWARAYRMTVEGKAFAALTCSYKPEREIDLLYTKPISLMTDIYGVRSDYSGKPVVNKQIIKEEHLAVGSVKGNYLSDQWKELGVTVDLSSSENLLVRKLIDGRIDVVPTVKENFLYITKKLGVKDKIKFFLKEDYEISTFHLVISRKWPDAEKLCRLFDEKLKEMKQDGTYESIHARYR